MKPKEKSSTPPTAMDLRATLKTIIVKELQNLPGYLEEMEKKDRVAIVCKLLPLVCPRTDSVHHTIDEPWD